MNTMKPSQHSLLALKQHTLAAIFICYLPHFTTMPWWVSIIFLAGIGYRLIADYFSYPLMPRWMRFCIVVGCLVLLNGSIFSSGFFIRFLLIYIALKCIEMHTVRDLKVLVLCNFYLIFSALIIIQELWIIIYLLIAILANLSIMLKLSASHVSLKQISSRSSRQLLIAIPLSILLFYIFPRIDPLWHVPTVSQGHVGFNERMSPGSIAEVFNDDSIAMQITFKSNPILNGHWRGIILSSYTGESWNPSPYTYFTFSPLRELRENETADYEIIVEPNQKKWLFYEGYPIAGESKLLFSSNHGLIRQNSTAVTQRFAYYIKVQPALYQALKPTEYAEAIQLPDNMNPRLNAWAKKQFANTHQNVKSFIAFLQDYIHQQPFWYTLTPTALNSNRNQMDSFWFDTQKGFCEHYASAVTYILRAAGIPARVILGYYGGEWNPITRSITIQQNDAHAWLEYWQDGIGWQELDPTSFIAVERIDQTIRSRQIDLLNQQDYFNISDLSWTQKIKLFSDSARFFSERWFLFYNQNTQKNLLQRVGLGEWDKVQLLQASVGCMILFFTLLGLGYQWWQKLTLDPLLLEYHLLQKQFRRFKISTHLSATLKQQCKSLIDKMPDLTPTLSAFIDSYEQLRLKQSQNNSTENKKETVALFKKLRYTLRQRKSSKLTVNQAE
jgi:transglutaminase-like putative cysteine protease